VFGACHCQHGNDGQHHASNAGERGGVVDMLAFAWSEAYRQTTRECRNWDVLEWLGWLESTSRRWCV
jgi:hypothetical protein